MRTNIFKLFFLISVLIIVGCKRDDEGITDTDSRSLCVNAKLPEEFSLGGIDKSLYKLRGILEIWTKGDAPKLVTHVEVLPEFSENSDVVNFNVEIDEGVYDCLLWMDYVDVNSSLVEKDGISRYSDKFYNTSDLKNISVFDVNSLVNNNACDALFYSGEIQKENTSAAIDVELIRPFTKICIIEENLREYNLLKGLKAEFGLPDKFDVLNGMVVGENTNVVSDIANFVPNENTEGLLLTLYVFSKREKTYNGPIKLVFTTDKHGEQEVTIPEGLIPLIMGKQVNVSASMMTETPIEDTDYNITFNVSVLDWNDEELTVETQPVRAKVGDFFYADGSYSTKYIENNNNPCIGVVFAVSHDFGAAALDSPDNYDGKLENVHGWVVALNDINEEALAFVSDNSVVLPEGLGSGLEDIYGYKNTSKFRDNSENYPAMNAVITNVLAPGNTSGWYIGSVKQYLILSQVYAEVVVENKEVKSWEYLSVGKSIDKLKENGLAKHFENGKYWSSSINGEKVYRVGLSIDKDYGGTAAWDKAAANRVRAILTF